MERAGWAKKVSSLAWPFVMVESYSPGRANFSLYQFNTFAHPAGATCRKWDNQSMRECCRLRQRGHCLGISFNIFFFHSKRNNL